VFSTKVYFSFPVSQSRFERKRSQGATPGLKGKITYFLSFVFLTKVHDIIFLFQYLNPRQLRERDRKAQRQLKGKILPSWVPLTKLVVQIQKGIFSFSE
jgi:hypothetical protein